MRLRTARNELLWLKQTLIKPRGIVFRRDLCRGPAEAHQLSRTSPAVKLGGVLIQSAEGLQSGMKPPLHAGQCP